MSEKHEALLMDQWMRPRDGSVVVMPLQCIQSRGKPEPVVVRTSVDANSLPQRQKAGIYQPDAVRHGAEIAVVSGLQSKSVSRAIDSRAYRNALVQDAQAMCNADKVGRSRNRSLSANERKFSPQARCSADKIKCSQSRSMSTKERVIAPREETAGGYVTPRPSKGRHHSPLSPRHLQSPVSDVDAKADIDAELGRQTFYGNPIKNVIYTPQSDLDRTCVPSDTCSPSKPLKNEGSMSPSVAMDASTISSPVTYASSELESPAAKSPSYVYQERRLPGRFLAKSERRLPGRSLAKR